MSNQGARITPKQSSRSREKEGVKEEAGAELQLGEFQSSSAITTSEARELLTMIFSHRAGAGRFPLPKKDSERGAVVNQTQEYLEVFARFKNRESVEAVDRLLMSQADLKPFEKAQLGSLCCDTAEEAKTLIPSLEHKKTDSELDDLLNEITKLRNFVDV
ncbi:HRDC-like protein [Peziza echinospora]|nr:HRDC-like protein [Peziza echinospora]